MGRFKGENKKIINCKKMNCFLICQKVSNFKTAMDNLNLI